MTTAIRRRRGTTAQHSTFIGLDGETTIDTDKEVVVVHDGTTQGGFPLMRENGSNSALALGSAGTPSLKFTGDTNTGIYSPGADQVAISTNGTGRLFIASDGKIGLNVASPTQAQLVVASSAGANTAFFTDGTNSSIKFLHGGGGAIITTESGQYLGFGTSDTERMRLTSAGLLGLGTSSPDGTAHVHTASAGTVTPNSAADDLTVENSGAGGISILTPDASNSALFFGSPSDAVGAAIRWNYTNSEFLLGADKSGASTKLTSGDGVTAVTIDSSQRVGIGTTSPFALLHVKADTNKNLIVQNGGADAIEVSNYNTGDGYREVIFGGSALRFNTGTAGGGSSLERGRFDASGRFLVGTSSSAGLNANLQVRQNNGYAIEAFRSSNDANGSFIWVTKSRGTEGSPTEVLSGDSLGGYGFRGYDGAGYVDAAYIYAEADADWTTSGDTTDNPSRLVFSTTADGASSPTERMRIRSSGLVCLDGNNQDAPETNSATNGISFNCTTGSHAQFAKIAAAVAGFNRMSDDGTIIRLMQAGTEEGTISVSGSTISYNGAHLSRWSQLPGGAVREEILRGTVLSNIDEMCGWGEEENEQLNRMKVSDIEGDPNVSGVFQAWDDDDDTYTDDFYCAMTGDFIIRIAEGVTVQRGDLLMSAGDGTAKPQDDDIIRSKTVAKVTSTHVTCTYEDGSYCVPCVLMAC